MQWHEPSRGQYRHNSYKPYKEKGGCLLVWLIFTIAGGFLAGLFILTGVPQHILQAAGSNAPYMPTSRWIFGAITNFAVVICAIGIWVWKKWGWYGYIGIGLLGLALGIATRGLSFFMLSGRRSTSELHGTLSGHIGRTWNRCRSTKRERKWWGPAGS